MHSGATMKLAGRDGRSVSITPVGHELPSGIRDRDYDDWLWILGQVVSGDDRWSFRELCLTVEEAHELGTFLRQVANGSAPVFDSSGQGRVSPDLIFWKPNLAFSLAERRGRTVRIRVHFAAESAGPSQAEDEHWGTGQHLVEISIAAAALEEAAVQWEEDLAGFLAREKA